MTRRSTFTPVCLVYCSARPCQKGFVWSLLYSAITTVMALPDPPPQALASAMAIALTVRVSTRRRFTVPSLLLRAADARVHLSRAPRQEAFIFTLGLGRWHAACP